MPILGPNNNNVTTYADKLSGAELQANLVSPQLTRVFGITGLNAYKNTQSTPDSVAQGILFAVLNPKSIALGIPAMWDRHPKDPSLVMGRYIVHSNGSDDMVDLICVYGLPEQMGMPRLLGGAIVVETDATINGDEFYFDANDKQINTQYVEKGYLLAANGAKKLDAFPANMCRNPYLDSNRNVVCDVLWSFPSPAKRWVPHGIMRVTSFTQDAPLDPMRECLACVNENKWPKQPAATLTLDPGYWMCTRVGHGSCLLWPSTVPNLVCGIDRRVFRQEFIFETQIWHDWRSVLTFRFPQMQFPPPDLGTTDTAGNSFETLKAMGYSMSQQVCKTGVTMVGMQRTADFFGIFGF